MCLISKHNKKMGFIPSVSLPSWLTCPPDAPCWKLCYAHHLEQYRSNVRDSNMANYELWKRSPLLFEETLADELRVYRYFRWHVSGDIPDAKYFRMMVRLAQRLPEVRFWAMTKQYDIVNSYLRKHDGVLPDNLKIIFSAWGTQLIPDNPFNLPVYHVRFKDPAQNIYIPDDAFPCGSMGQCDHCLKCAFVKRGEHIVNHQH